MSTQFMQQVAQAGGIKRYMAGMANLTPQKMMTKDGLQKVENPPDANLFYNTGGLFVDCGLDRAVMNATLTPNMGLGDIIPVVGTTDENNTYSFVTAIDNGMTTPQDEVCDPAPAIGDMTTAEASYRMGRLTARSQSVLVTKIIQRANRGVHQDLFFVGDVRAVPVMPTPSQLNDRDFIQAGVINNQIQRVGRGLQTTLNRWLYIGDPTDTTNQTGAGEGWLSFWGLDTLISADYGTHTWVSGSNKTALNSTVIDFGGQVVGADSNDPTIFEAMELAGEVVTSRAGDGGQMVDWAIVMHPITWQQVLKVIPCQQVANGCAGTAVPNSGSGSISAEFNYREQRRLDNERIINLAGKDFTIVTDASVPLTRPDVVGEPTQYSGTIFFVPLRVNNIPVLKWKHVDYRFLENALAPVGGLSMMNGWTDGGRVLWQMDYLHKCIEVEGEMGIGLEFNAPHLSARIDDVIVDTTIARQLPIPSTDITI